MSDSIAPDQTPDRQTLVALEGDRGRLQAEHEVATEADTVYRLEFGLALAADATGRKQDVHVFWNDELVGVATASDAEPTPFSFEVVGTGGDDRLRFDDGSAPDGAVLLDDVRLVSATETLTLGGGGLVSSDELSDEDGEPDDADDSVPLQDQDATVVTTVEMVKRGDGSVQTMTGAASSGESVFRGGDRDERFYGSAGDDRMSGGGKQDVLEGGAGNDSLDGGSGRDVAVFSGNRADYRITAGSGGQLVVEDIRAGSPDGKDMLKRIEQLRFADGDVAVADIRAAGSDDGTSAGAAAGKVLAGTEDDDRIRGGDGADVLAGGGGDDVLRGGSNKDLLGGGDGDDVLRGENHDDVLLGGAGDDRLAGGAKNDLLMGGAGDDRLDGGAGTDTAVFTGNRADYRITAAGGRLIVEDLRSGTPDGTDSLSRVERLVFADGELALADLVPDAAGGGNGSGGGSGNGSGSGSGGGTATGTDGDDSLRGGRGEDDLSGGAGDDRLVGRAGDDLLTGGAGDDQLIGGAGTDTAVFSGNRADYRITEGKGGQLTVDDLRPGAPDGTDSLRKVEQLRFADGDIAVANLVPDAPAEDSGGGSGGGSGGESLTGTDGDDVIRGGDGDDQLSGGPGDDLLRGGSGADRLLGGEGDDVLRGENHGDELDGGPGDDQLFGQAQDDVLIGGPGDDRLDGGAGTDTAVYGGDRADYRIGPAEGGGLEVEDTRTGSPDGKDTLEDVERLRFADGEIAVADIVPDTDDGGTGGTDGDGTTGTESDDVLHGGSGDDWLEGGAGNDVIRGGEGDDELTGGPGDDLLRGGSGADRLLGGEGDDVLRGENHGDELDGGPGDDQLFGQAQDDVLTGGPGDDRLDGGAGTDTAVYGGDRGDYHIGPAESGGLEVEDIRTGSPDGKDTLEEIERLRFADGEIAVADIVPDTDNGEGEGPTPSTADVAENDPGAIVRDVALGGDTGGAPLFTVDDDRFEVADGKLKLKDGQLLDHEAEPSLVVTVTGPGPDGSPVQQCITISVLDRNDAPVVAPIAPVTVSEEACPIPIDLLAGAYDPEGSDLDVASVVVTAADGRDVAFTVDGETGLLTLDPSQFDDLGEGQTLSLGVDFSVVDADGASTPNSAAITVTGSNDAPVVAPIAPVTVSEEACPIPIDLLAGAFDPEGGDLDLASVVVTAADGRDVAFTVDGETGLLTIDPAQFDDLGEGETLALGVDFSVVDADGASTPNSAAINVTGSNDAPVVAAIAPVTVSEEAAPLAIDLLVGASDPEGGDLDVASVVVTAVDGRNVTFTIDSETGSFGLDPRQFADLGQGQVLDLDVLFDVVDEAGASTPNSARVSVTGTADGDPIVTCETGNGASGTRGGSGKGTGGKGGGSKGGHQGFDGFPDQGAGKGSGEGSGKGSGGKGGGSKGSHQGFDGFPDEGAGKGSGKGSGKGGGSKGGGTHGHEDRPIHPPEGIGCVEDRQVTIRFDGEGAGYRNGFGVYRIDVETGAIHDVELIWANASAAGSGGKLVPGQSSATIEVAAGDRLGFFLVEDGAAELKGLKLDKGSFVFVSPSGEQATIEGGVPQLWFAAPGGAPERIDANVYHTIAPGEGASLNPDGIDHAQLTLDPTAGTLGIAFEDLFQGGDRDFDDLRITVDLGPESVQAIAEQWGIDGPPTVSAPTDAATAPGDEIAGICALLAEVGDVAGPATLDDIQLVTATDGPDHLAEALGSEVLPPGDVPSLDDADGDRCGTPLPPPEPESDAVPGGHHHHGDHHGNGC